MIFSNYDALYLDCGYGAWVGEGNNWCSPYKGWLQLLNFLVAYWFLIAHKLFHGSYDCIKNVQMNLEPRKP